MMRVRVTKMHGARNDFVILDGRIALPRDTESFARWACDRHAGIGADGLIVLEASTRAHVRMRTINADGSEAEMCGNGVRCAARWLDEAGEGASVTFETAAGVVATEILSRGPEYLVRVAMGRARVAPVAIPGLDDAAFVDVGNPHVVTFVANLDDVDLLGLAARVQHAPGLPAGANVHAVQRAGDRSVRARHWERGAGLTMACGTGAVACAAVAIERKIAASPVEVLVPGGRLVVELDADGNAYLTGPAVRVFDTEVEA